MTPILTTLAPGLLEAGSRLIMVSSGRSPIRKGANLRNYSISAMFVTGCRPR